MRVKRVLRVNSILASKLDYCKERKTTRGIILIMIIKKRFLRMCLWKMYEKYVQKKEKMNGKFIDYDQIHKCLNEKYFSYLLLAYFI